MVKTAKTAKARKPRAKSQSLVAIVDGCSVSQVRAVEALLTGAPLHMAAKAAGVSPVTLRQWMVQEGPFKDRLTDEARMLDDRIARARKALVDSVIQTGAAGAARLLRHVNSTDANKSLSASKAAYAGAVALAKGNEDTGVSFGPMFVLPAGAVMSLDTSPAPLPLTPASVVVDAQVLTVQQDTSNKAKQE